MVENTTERNLQDPNPRKARTLLGGKVFAVVVLAGFCLYLGTYNLTYNVKSRDKGSTSNDRKLHIIKSGISNSPLAKNSNCTDLIKLNFEDNFNGVHYPRPTTYDREECACSPVHNFVILSMQRSGSGWFETLLNNHPNVSSNGEIFSLRHRRKNFDSIKRTLDTVYRLEWVSSASKNTCTNAVGFKWMLNQGAMEYHREVKAYFYEHSVSIILLLRRNVLKRLISILANAYDRKNKQLGGFHKSHVHSKEEAEKLANYKPALNVEHLISNLQRVQKIGFDALRVFNGTRLMVLFYEDVVKDSEKLDDVQKFLGVPLRKLESRQVKIHTRSLRLQIDNYAEVENALKSSEFSNLLTED